MRIALASLLLLAAGCHRDEPPAPSAEQADQLNEADAMLDNLSNEEGPEANASGPSNSSD